MNFLRTATTKTDFLWSHGRTTSTWPKALSCSNGLSHLQVRNVPKILKRKKKITFERQHLNPWTSLCPYDYITRLNNTEPNTKQQTLLHCSSQHERNIHYIQFATNNTKSVHVQIFFKTTCADKKKILILWRKINENYHWFSVSMHPLTYKCTEEVAKHKRRERPTRGYSHVTPKVTSLTSLTSKVDP